MRLNVFTALLISFSLMACGTAPKGDICAIDSASRLVCRKPDATVYFVPTGNAINYYCMSPEYAEKLFQYWSTRCSK